MLFHPQKYRQMIVRLYLSGGYTEVYGGFLKWGYPKTIDVNTNMVIHDLDDLGVPPVSGNLNISIYIYMSRYKSIYFHEYFEVCYGSPNIFHRQHPLQPLLQLGVSWVFAQEPLPTANTRQTLKETDGVPLPGLR